MGDWKPINSSNISLVRYDAAALHMDVGFSNGTIYRYADVPPAIYDGLTADDNESPGRYFGEKVKGVYAFTKVDVDGRPLDQNDGIGKDAEAQAAVEQQGRAEPAEEVVNL